MWNTQNKSEMACVFASLILNDNSLEVSEESLKKICSAAEVKIENYWLYLFPNLIKGINFTDLIGASYSPTTKIVASINQAPLEEKKEETQESSSNKESDEDMGFGLFD